MTSPLPYDLCLKLKEAGWPQPVGAQVKEWNERGGSIVFGEEIGGLATAWAYSPSLEELIEACPKDAQFDLLRFPASSHLRGWRATLNLGTLPPGLAFAEHDILWGEGATPKEALAHLWLKLPEDEKG